MVESGWSNNTAGTDDHPLDPMEDRIFGAIQDSIDRSRVRNHRIIVWIATANVDETTVEPPQERAVRL